MMSETQLKPDEDARREKNKILFTVQGTVERE